MVQNAPREITVFIASPGDLAPERKVFKDTIDTLNSGFADGAGVKFVALGWEDVMAETGRRTQGVIDQQLETCDLFILALHRRWGQKAPDSKYSSYTEEEFRLAFDLWQKTKAPEVLVFFKMVDNASVGDAGPQLKKVLKFRRDLEGTHEILIRSFNSEMDFGKEIDKHLRAFARGEWKKLDDAVPTVNLPAKLVDDLKDASRKGEERIEQGEEKSKAADAAVEGAKKEADNTKADLSLVKVFQTELTFARAAVDAARAGRVEDARILFAQATEGTTDLSILSAAAEFFRQVNDLENASRMVQRQAAIARDRAIAARHYISLVPSGLLAASQSQLLEQSMSQYPPEIAEEIRSVYQEVFGGQKLEQFLLDMMIKYYTVEEIVQLATFLASPVGQSSLQKQQAMMLEIIQFAQKESLRVLGERHPDWVEQDAAEQDTDDDDPQLAEPQQAGRLTAGTIDAQDLPSAPGTRPPN